MIIKELGIRGFKSYGNIEQTLELNTQKGELILLSGSNGSGKCVHGTTSIDIDIDDLELNSDLVNYLETTDKGKVIFLYLKENKKLLYEKIIRFNTNE